MVDLLIPGYLKYDGQKYIIDPNPIGPAGPPGQNGLIGPPGETGQTGPQGPAGVSGGALIFVYQANGVNSGNVYNTFLAAYNAAVAVRESSPTIIIDNTLGNPEVLSGTYNFDNLTLQGLLFSSENESQTQLQFNNGVIININYGFNVLSLNLISTTTSAPIISYNTNVVANIYLKYNSTLTMSSTATQSFINLIGGNIYIYGGTLVSLGSAPVLSNNSGGAFIINIDNQDDGIGDNCLSGSGTFVVNISSLLAVVSQTQTAALNAVFNVGFGGDILYNGTTSETVVGLQTIPVMSTTPTDGQHLTYLASNNSWQPTTGTYVFAYNTSQQTIASSSTSQVNVTHWTANVNINPLGSSSFNLTTGVFTAPNYGIYHISAGLEFNVTSVSQGTIFLCQILAQLSTPTNYNPAIKNYIVAGYISEGGNNYPGNPIVSASLLMNQGDTFTIQTQQSSGSNIQLTNNSSANFLTIASQ